MAARVKGLGRRHAFVALNETGFMLQMEKFRELQVVSSLFEWPNFGNGIIRANLSSVQLNLRKLNYVPSSQDDHVSW